MQGPIALTGPAPNPVSEKAILRFAVENQTPATIAIYNTLGQRVRTVFKGVLAARENRGIEVDASSLSSGHYFIRLVSAGRVASTRMTVVR